LLKEKAYAQQAMAGNRQRRQMVGAVYSLAKTAIAWGKAMSVPERKTFTKGSVIFKEGESGREAYLLQKGKVRIFKTVSGKRITIGIVQPGQVFGELALLDNGGRMGAAVVEEEALCLVMSKASIDHMMNEAPAGLATLVHSLLGTMRVMGDELAQAKAELAELKQD
jgi:CRP/FNR family transcriptional regulator, cyclic AMP receptor protein